VSKLARRRAHWHRPRFPVALLTSTCGDSCAALYSDLAKAPMEGADYPLLAPGVDPSRVHSAHRLSAPTSRPALYLGAISKPATPRLVPMNLPTAPVQPYEARAACQALSDIYLQLRALRSGLDTPNVPLSALLPISERPYSL